MAGVTFISQPLLKGYFCRQAIAVVGVGMERVEEGCLSIFSSEYLKKKKRFLKGRSIFILLGLFFLSGKLPNRIYYPVSLSHAESKDR